MDNKTTQFQKYSFSALTEQGALALKSEFVSNDPEYGKKVLSSIEDGLKKCDCFYISVAFITSSGIEPLLPVLKDLENRDIKGQILTTDYLNFSEPRALEKLARFKNISLKMYVTANAKVRENSGFHTKGYIFRKDESYQIIIGSSNLTQSALTYNKEWNTRLDSKENEKFVKDVLHEFNSLWNSENAKIYEDYKSVYEESYKIVKAQKKAAISSKDLSLETYKLMPNRMQSEFIDSLKALIAKGEKKALLISATGTGKTYASAFAVRELKAKKALFIVHREQIAKQAMKSYGIVFNNTKTTALLSGTQKDIDNADFIFATMQTICKEEYLHKFRQDEFDVIVIDEAHHAGASSYDKIMNYFEPNILYLGMTASPERSDDIDIFSIFDHNIAYEIRLQQALEHDFLCPFHYFGITDLVDVNYEKLELSDFNLLCSEKRASFIMEQMEFYSYSGDKPRGLIFCSRKDIAKELSDIFNRSGRFRTIVLTGKDKQSVRDDAVRRLEADKSCSDYVDYIFSVDIFNEGVDIPKVNQVVMLRPTQSPIVFVQQLGRGLRKYRDKEFVVILDFIGNHQNNYMIPMALSGDRSYDKENLRRYVQEGERIIPGASTIHFDEIAKSKIFASIDTSNFSAVKLIRDNYEALKHKLGRIPKLSDFEKYGQMDVQCIFRSSLGSYYNFLDKYEKEFKGTLTPLQAKHLEFVSKHFANGKLDSELLILKEILKGNYTDLLKHLEVDKGIALTQIQKVNLSNVMSNNFITGTAKSSIEDIRFARTDGDDLKVDDSFKEMLKNSQFCEFLEELVEYSLDFYQKNYAQSKDGFSLYKRYSYADVCRLLDWSESVVAQNIGGYRYDKTTNTLPIFVNYQKDESISSSTKYEDEFLNHSVMSWISKSNRRLSSPELKPIFEQSDTKTKIELFVRKNNSVVKLSDETLGKSKDAFKEFYYLGRVNFIEDSAKEITMKNDKDKAIPAVQLFLRLEEPVRDDIFDYIVNK